MDRNVCVIAGGMSKWGVREGSQRDFFQEAAKACYNDNPQLNPKDIDGLLVASAYTERTSYQTHLFPQQSKEFNQIYPFYQHLREGLFTTTKCKDCGVESFPPRVMCPECYSTNMEWVDWPTTATVIEFTEEVVGVPLGFGRAPLIHALIDLQGKKNFFVRIINCQAGQLKAGDQVKLAVFDVDPVPQDVGREVVEIPRVFYAFGPVK